jgi:hypothetical protein
MASKKTAVFGIYSTREGVERAAESLSQSNFPVTDISVLLPQTLGDKDIGTEKATKAPEGAATGAGSGAVLGGTLGLLVGIGALSIPGVAPLVAAGPIMATLAGIGAGGVVGGLTGGLIGIGIPEYEAKRYEGLLQRGGILLSVHCDTSEDVSRAKEIMKLAGGEDISSTGESTPGTAKTDDRFSRRASGGND